MNFNEWYAKQEQFGEAHRNELLRAWHGALASNGWIQLSERMPGDTGCSYQVVALSTKIHDSGNYAGEPVKTIVQDWVIRKWPHNFTHWMPLPAIPQAMEDA